MANRNPLLVMFRKDVYYLGAETALEIWQAENSPRIAGQDQNQVDHALKVVERLAAITTEGAES